MATPRDFVPPSENWRLPMDPNPRYRPVPRLPRIASLLAPTQDTGVTFARDEIQRPAAPTYTPRSLARAVYQELKPTTALETSYVDPPIAERRLYYHHSDPHKIHEIHMHKDTLPYEHSTVSRKHLRTYEAESGQKRRRVTQREQNYSGYSPRMEAQQVAAPRYIRQESDGLEKVKPPISRMAYNKSDRPFRPSVMKTPAPCTPSNDEATPLTTLVLKSKEFLKSNNLVRNRHDEIDWVATFLKVGFDASSIYALMCPLRKGRWKSEEENYTMGLLRLIENGTILLRHGQSIRGYIGGKLHSDDMRVLKKLSNCKMFHFAKLINPRLAEEEKLDMSVAGAQEGLEQLDQLKGEFLRSVQLEALVAVRKYLSDSSLRDLLNVRA